MDFTLTLNRRPWSGPPPDPNLTLLQLLRRSGLTGAKEGCAEGDCGACAVAMLDRDAEGRPAWRAINSCLVPALTLQGREIITAEGVGTPAALHPIQESMVRHHGSQCGYCTPGIVCSLYEAWHRTDLQSQAALTEQLSGNLCRCTGYRPIQDAAREALHHPGRPAAGSEAATLPDKLPAFSSDRFHRPDSLAELLRLQRENPHLRLVAGATETGLDITKKFLTFQGWISTDAVPELHVLEKNADAWTMGAAVPLTKIADAAGPDFPALAKMLWLFGSRLIRNRATLGGNLATASPIGDSAPVLMALNASVILASEEGIRTVSVSDFFVSYRKSALLPHEVIQAVRIPLPTAPEGQSHTQFYKVSRRLEMDISTVSGAFHVETDAAGTITLARIAFGGVAATPTRAPLTEAALLGRPWSAETLVRAAGTALTEFTPLSDVRGSAAYRRSLIGGMLRRFFSDPPWRPDPAPLPEPPPVLSLPDPHESARLHVTGTARYTDDFPPAHAELTAWPVGSPHAHARILTRDAAAARTMPGIHAVLLAEDIPGLNDVGAVRQDEILLADQVVSFHGHPVALVVGETEAQCRAAAAAVVVTYEPLPAWTTVQAAIQNNSYHTDPAIIRRGDADAALTAAPFRISGEFHPGGQEHFYLETHAARAIPGDDGSLHIISSTQHPSEIQAVVAHVLHLPRNLISVESPRMGGGFGGKETQGNTPAAFAALAAMKTGRPVRVRFNRDQDMQLSGHRHPFLATFEAGHDAEGRLLAVKSSLVSDGGWALDLSTAITDRALLHHDNAYHIPAMEVTGRVAKTHLSSNTAFRGFGGPQGMLIMEEIIHRIARNCGLPPELVRQRNLYQGEGGTNTTHYGQDVGDQRIPRIWNELAESASLTNRRRGIETWNAAHPDRKRGLAMTPVKFGISFTLTHLNQAGALVLIYQDGTVQVNHGGTEMGQGLHTKIQTIVCRELGLTPDRVRLMPTRTDKVPNTSPTAASSGTDLNGAAVRNACLTLKERLIPLARTLLKSTNPDAIPAFDNNTVSDGPHTIDFPELIFRAYLSRIPLAATGSYATPEIGWDRTTGTGRPFFYFACGAAVSEVEIDGFSGACQLRRVDILHDVGDSLNSGIDRGQIEGAFIQGMGWLTMEKLSWDNQGRLLTHSPDTYKIPAIGDCPPDFRVEFLTNAAHPGTVHGTKAVGEPPLMLAISVRHAILDAIAAFPDSHPEALTSPATGEAILQAITYTPPHPAQKSLLSLLSFLSFPYRPTKPAR
ncbi:MAG: xdh, partial [Verrucomicrobiales bacterium]|nr:xdh [Verrucomicrobiales bacterium]